jgi:hypothetical protein
MSSQNVYFCPGRGFAAEERRESKLLRAFAEENCVVIE